MADVPITSSTSSDHEIMHSTYRIGGQARQMAPHVVYKESSCPHPGCDQHIQAIDFRLENHGRDVHDALVKAWWDDLGFVGKCPKCGGWIHFTIRDKIAINEDQASQLPQLPDDWFDKANVL